MKKIINKQWKIIVTGIFLSLLLIITINSKTVKKTQVIETQLSPTPTIILTEYTLIDSHRGEPIVTDFESKGQQDNNFYFKLLKNKIINDNLSAKVWFDDTCNQFWLWDRELDHKEENVYQIEHHSVASAKCFGVASLQDMFGINKKTNEIYWLDNSTGQFITYDEWAKTISKQK